MPCQIFDKQRIARKGGSWNTNRIRPPLFLKENCKILEYMTARKETTAKSRGQELFFCMPLLPQSYHRGMLQAPHNILWGGSALLSQTWSIWTTFDASLYFIPWNWFWAHCVLAYGGLSFWPRPLKRRDGWIEQLTAAKMESVCKLVNLQIQRRWYSEVLPQLSLIRDFGRCFHPLSKSVPQITGSTNSHFWTYISCPKPFILDQISG